MNDDEKVKFKNLFNKYHNVFAFPGDQLGRTSLVQHIIDTGNAMPIEQRPYRVSPDVKKEIDRQVDEMLEKGIIQESVSPWSSLSCFVNSGANFQRLMGHILRGLEYRFALIYIDDIIILSKPVDEHFVHLEEVFKRLRDANVTLNPEKCSFVKQRVEYLCHVVTPEGNTK